MGTSFFLLLPEALQLIQAGLGGGHDDHGHRLLEGDEGPGESASTWRFGSSVMGTYMSEIDNITSKTSRQMAWESNQEYRALV